MSGPNGDVAAANGEGKATKPAKMSKNAWRRLKQKKEKSEAPSREASQAPSVASEATLPADPPSDSAKTAPKLSDAPDNSDPTQDFDLEPEIPLDDPLYEQFKGVLARFGDRRHADPSLQDPDKGQIFYEDEDDGIQSEEEEAETKRAISKKKQKEASRLSVAELKALAKKPELVEWTDTHSSDPRLLLAIKASKNVVPVPPHWSLKREYLSTKRGIEKPPFQLPKFIADTGIGEMRDAVLEKQNEQTLKQKQRERVAPKMGKLDVDYSKLYEAFFRFQTKPELTRYGEVYYEGKEYETNMRHLKPGDLSEELRAALNMPPGAPPPWLINQQRFGPPPSYPALKIPGLNAPPPPGGSWGFHPGGYGKPPVDEHNRPLYGGDIFGNSEPQQRYTAEGEPVDRDLWGELEEQEEDAEEEEEDEEEEDEDEEADEDGTQTSATSASVSTFNPGTESVAGDFLLRKHKPGTETEEPAAGPRSAGRVISESAARSSGFFGSDRTYDLSSGSNQGLHVLGHDENPRKRKVGDIDVSMDLDELQRDGRISKDQLAQHYEAGKRAEQPSGWNGVDQEDLTNMIAEESRKRLKKDEERRRKR